MKLAKIAVASSNVGKKVVGGLVLAASSGVALAQQTGATGPDLSSLTSSISMGTVITGVLAVAATMVGLYLAIKGAKTILGMIKSA
jgi:hypothetical protein